MKKVFIALILIILSCCSSVALGFTVTPPKNTRLSKNKFIDVALKNDHEQMIKLINSGVNIDTQDFRGMTALMHVSSTGNTETLKLLLENGVDVNMKDDFKKTALMWAIERGHTEIAKLLLENGADVDANNYPGETALMWAANYGYNESVKLLLAKGADVNNDNFFGYTALMWATGKGNTETVKILIENSANVNMKDKDERTALMIAKKKGHKKIVEILKAAGAKEFETQPKQQEAIGNETSNWITYRNEEYGFEFKYPQTLKGLGPNGQIKEERSSRYPESGEIDTFSIRLYRTTDKSKMGVIRGGFSVGVTPKDDLLYNGLEKGLYLGLKSGFTPRGNVPKVPVYDVVIGTGNYPAKKISIPDTNERFDPNYFYLLQKGEYNYSIGSGIRRAYGTNFPSGEEATEDIFPVFFKILSTFKFIN